MMIDEILVFARYADRLGEAYLTIAQTHSAFFYRNEHGPAMVDAIPELASVRERLFALSQEAGRINQSLWEIEKKRTEALSALLPSSPAAPDAEVSPQSFPTVP